eukprot:1161155-Pelagomonas_calceolata.AAC.2
MVGMVRKLAGKEHIQRHRGDLRWNNNNLKQMLHYMLTLKNAPLLLIPVEESMRHNSSACVCEPQMHGSACAFKLESKGNRKRVIWALITKEEVSSQDATLQYYHIQYHRKVGIPAQSMIAPWHCWVHLHTCLALVDKRVQECKSALANKGVKECKSAMANKGAKECKSALANKGAKECKSALANKGAKECKSALANKGAKDCKSASANKGVKEFKSAEV